MKPNLLKIALMLNQPKFQKSEIVLKISGDQLKSFGPWGYDIFFDKLNVSGDWGHIGRAFYNAGCTVSMDDDENIIVLEFDPKDEIKVREILEHARNGGFGPDAQAFWSQTKEI